MGWFHGRNAGDAVTYIGDGLSGVIDAIERPRAMHVSRNANGRVIARTDHFFKPPTYDVAFGEKRVNAIPARELCTDRIGQALGPLSHPGIGASNGALAETIPSWFTGLFAVTMVTIAAIYFITIAIIAGLTGLGAGAWQWIYSGVHPGMVSARAWSGLAVLLAPVAILTIGHTFVVPKRRKVVFSAILVVCSWSAWYVGGSAHKARPIEAVVVGALLAATVVTTAFRLRGTPLHLAWFWYPLGALIALAAVLRDRAVPLPTWKALHLQGVPGQAVATAALIALALLVCCGAAIYMLDLLNTDELSSHTPRQRRTFIGIGLAVGSISLFITGRFVIGANALLAHFPDFGLSGEVFMLILLLPAAAGATAIVLTPPIAVLREAAIALGVRDIYLPHLLVLGGVISPAVLLGTRYL